MIYNNTTNKNNRLSAAMRAKGYSDFEIIGSAIPRNQHNGYWLYCQENKALDMKWLGVTFKDALSIIRNEIPNNEKTT